MKIDTEVYLVERISKNGNKYTALEIYLTENVKKLILLNEAEIELLKLNLDIK